MIIMIRKKGYESQHHGNLLIIGISGSDSFLKKLQKIESTLYTILQILRVTVFEKMHILQVLTDTYYTIITFVKKLSFTLIFLIYRIDINKILSYPVILSEKLFFHFYQSLVNVK